MHLPTVIPQKKKRQQHGTGGWRNQMPKIILIAAGTVIAVLAAGYIAAVIVCVRMRYDDQLLD